MDGEKIKLSEAEILAHSETLNTAAQNINDTCKKLYGIITNLQESEAFKSKEAAMNYYLRIQEINAVVPKFIEGILKFSQFLSGYLLENYRETDEMAKQIQESFDESVNQLAAIGLIGGVVNIGKISSTAQGALNGNFISSDQIYKEAFEDTGNLEFVTRDDGAIMITRDGVPIGFTTKDGISNPRIGDDSKHEDSYSSQYPSGMGNDPRYQQLSPSGMGDDPRYKNIRPETPLTEGMGNNEAIIKARENGRLPNPTDKNGIGDDSKHEDAYSNQYPSAMKGDPRYIGDDSRHEDIYSSQPSLGSVQKNSSTLDQGFTFSTTNSSGKSNSTNAQSPSIFKSGVEVQKNSSSLDQGFTVSTTSFNEKISLANLHSSSGLESLSSSKTGQAQTTSSAPLREVTIPSLNANEKSDLANVHFSTGAEILNSLDSGQTQTNSSTIPQGIASLGTNTNGGVDS